MGYNTLEEMSVILGLASREHNHRTTHTCEHSTNCMVPLTKNNTLRRFNVWPTSETLTSIKPAISQYHFFLGQVLHDATTSTRSYLSNCSPCPAHKHQGNTRPHYPANTKHFRNVGPTSKTAANIKTTLGKCLVFAG